MMKFKPNQTRTYDREGYKKRAACLCFRSEREDEVLLVSSSRYPDQWIVPGGGMEPEEEPGGAAVREVYEEAGVKGKLGRLLGIFEQNQDRKHRTYVYVLTVTEILEDWEDSVNIAHTSNACPSLEIGASAQPTAADLPPLTLFLNLLSSTLLWHPIILKGLFHCEHATPL
ncbi:diphosphoinositol polyphosphate phosphohydrolase 2 isoform X3 [Aphelocoma coerulescens]|uniref:diphosphoinositol polyphosphate phosphohydrolase 2 isoform X3 n=1 Tax=Aphelocoma coerulescens TaxID=39617 RepID=UPI003604E564